MQVDELKSFFLNKICIKKQVNMKFNRPKSSEFSQSSINGNLH